MDGAERYPSIAADDADGFRKGLDVNCQLETLPAIVHVGNQFLTHGGELWHNQHT